MNVGVIGPKVLEKGVGSSDAATGSLERLREEGVWDTRR